MGNGKHLTRSKSDSSKGRHHHHHQRHHQKRLKGAAQQRHHQGSSKQQIKDHLSENLSFCGCGFLGIYHVGVASCFHEYAPQLSMHKIAGSSAGALVAVAHICGNLQLAYATTDILRVAIDARARTLGPFHPSFDINSIVREALERVLPDDVHIKVTGKLHISLTRVYDGENVIVSNFESKEDVIQALICSCFIPFWSGFMAPKYKGVTYIDGGFSNNLLILDDKTVTVSPFAGEADICPRDDVYNLLSVSISNTSFSITPHNLYRLSHALLPPPPEVLSELCEQGFADGIRFLQKMKLISCTKCLEIQSSLLVSTSTTMATSTTTTTTMTTTTNGQQQQQHQQHQQTEFIEQTYSASYSSSQRRGSLSSLNSNYNASNNHHAQSNYSETQVNNNNNYGNSNIYSPASSDDNNEYANFEDDNCDGCVLRRKNALRDPLPKQFTDRIREACDNVNKSLYNWFYSHRPIKYLSYLAAPYYLPMNISLALFLKYWQQLPSIGFELIKCVYDLKDFLLEIVRRLSEKSTTSILMSPSDDDNEVVVIGDNDGGKSGADRTTKQSTAKSSISVKITADCRRSDVRSLTTYECCLTVVLFGRQTLLSIRK